MPQSILNERANYRSVVHGEFHAGDKFDISLTIVSSRTIRRGDPRMFLFFEQAIAGFCKKGSHIYSDTKVLLLWCPEFSSTCALFVLHLTEVVSVHSLVDFQPVGEPKNWRPNS